MTFYLDPALAYCALVLKYQLKVGKFWRVFTIFNFDSPSKTEKLKDSNFAHLFENETKMKVPSKIKTPVTFAEKKEIIRNRSIPR